MPTYAYLMVERAVLTVGGVDRRVVSVADEYVSCAACAAAQWHEAC